MRHENTQKLVKGNAAVVETYPPFYDVPSSATARFGTPSTAMPTSASAATVDSNRTTVSVAAAQGDTSIQLAGVVDVVPGQRLLILPFGASNFDAAFPITVTSNGTTGTIELAEPLTRDVALSSEVIGYRMTVALSSSDTATLGPGVVEWQATDGNLVVHKWSTMFRVVERDGTYTLTPDVLTSSSPYCRDNKPDNDDDFTETIDAAWRRYVEPALLGKALRPERIVHGPHFEAVHIAACEHYLAQQFEDDMQRRAEFKAEHSKAIEQVLAASDLWITSEVEDLTNADPNSLELGGNLQGVMPIGTYPDGSSIYSANDLNVTFCVR